MLNRSVVRIVLAGVIGLVLVGGVVGLLTVDNNKSDKVSTEPGSSTTTAFATSTTSTTVVPSSTTVTTAAPAASSTTTSTTKAAATTTTVAPTPGATKAPATGSYSYDLTSTTGSAATVKGVDTLGVVGIGSSLQRITSHRGGISMVDDVNWADPLGATIQHSTLSQFGITLDCAWNKPVLRYASSLRVGTQWTTSASCGGDVAVVNCGMTTFSATQSSANVVTGAGLASIGGKTVPVWQIKRSNWTFTVHATSPSCNISWTVIIQAQEQFAADKGLVGSADDSVSTAIIFPGQTEQNTTSHEVRALKSLSPS